MQPVLTGGNLQTDSREKTAKRCHFKSKSRSITGIEMRESIGSYIKTIQEGI
jgi:NADPH-dependent glutamate synthase beta subunit-like oxidoreductase